MNKTKLGNVYLIERCCVKKGINYCFAGWDLLNLEIQVDRWQRFDMKFKKEMNIFSIIDLDNVITSKMRIKQKKYVTT